MNAKVLLSVVAATLGTAAAANAQVGQFTLDWLVDGQNSVDVNPGDTVTVTGIARWTPAAHGLGSLQFRVNLGGADATDSLAYAEASGLGRNTSLRMLPAVLSDGSIVGGRQISGMMGTVIDAAQLPQMMNPFFNGSNPIEVFRFQLTAGDADRSITIDSPIQALTLMSNMQGIPTVPYSRIVDGATINVVPTPGAAALLGLGGAVCLRRRRTAR